MGNKLLSIILLATAAAVTGFFILRDASFPSPVQNSSSPVSPSRESGEVRNTTSVTGSPGDKSTGQGGAGSTMAELQEEYAAISDNPDYPQLQTRLDAMQKRQPDRSFEPERVVETMARSEAWNRI